MIKLIKIVIFIISFLPQEGYLSSFTNVKVMTKFFVLSSQQTFGRTSDGSHVATRAEWIENTQKKLDTVKDRLDILVSKNSYTYITEFKDEAKACLEDSGAFPCLVEISIQWRNDLSLKLLIKEEMPASDKKNLAKQVLDLLPQEDIKRRRL